MDLAVENGALIRYAQTAQSPWFTYKKSGMDHVVWFEDVRSIQAKWKLVQELDLAGARMQEETLDMKQGERSMISREDNEINEKETM